MRGESKNVRLLVTTLETTCQSISIGDLQISKELFHRWKNGILFTVDPLRVFGKLFYQRLLEVATISRSEKKSESKNISFSWRKMILKILTSKKIIFLNFFHQKKKRKFRFFRWKSQNFRFFSIPKFSKSFFSKKKYFVSIQIFFLPRNCPYFNYRCS